VNGGGGGGGGTGGVHTADHDDDTRSPAIIRTTTLTVAYTSSRVHAPTVLPVPSYTIARVYRLVVSRAPSPRFSAMNKPLPPPPRYPSHLLNYNMRRRSVTYRYCPSAGKCLWLFVSVFPAALLRFRLRACIRGTNPCPAQLPFSQIRVMPLFTIS